MPEPQDREFLRSVFLMEAWDTVAALEEGLDAWSEPSGPGPTRVDSLFVVTHRLKGAAGLHGFPRVAELAAAMERIVEEASGASAAERRALAQALGSALACLKDLLDGIAAGGVEDSAPMAAFQAERPALFDPVERIAGERPATRMGEPSGIPPGEGDDMIRELHAFFAESSDVLEFFGPEAADHLEAMTTRLLSLENRAGGALDPTGDEDRTSEEDLATLFRATHTLKGAAYTVGCRPVGRLAHEIENLLVAIRRGETSLTPTMIEGLLTGVDALRLMLRHPAESAGALATALERALGGLRDLASPQSLPMEETPAPGVRDQPDPPRALEPVPREASPSLAGSRDRPASSPARASIRVNLDRLDSLMNLVGELIIARGRLDQHLVEMDRVGELLGFGRDRLSQTVKDFEEKHLYPTIEASAASADGRAGSPTPAAVSILALADVFHELEFDRYDSFSLLARRVGEACADVAEIQAQLTGLRRAIREDAARIQHLTGELRGELTRARMVAFGTLSARFARQVREVSRLAGRQVRLEISGEAVELDNTLIEQVTDPLLHLVQNAISHGIETPAERLIRGKPTEGTISLSASHGGGFVYVEVADDGQGLDGEVLKTQAVEKSFLDAGTAQRLTPREALDLVFLRGFSTASSQTVFSGRGVGMDVVRTNVRRLGGEIDVESEVGVGTRFVIKLPLTLAITAALTVRVGPETFAVPVTAIKRLLMVDPREVQAAHGFEQVLIEEDLVELVHLDRMLGLPPSSTNGAVPTVVLRAGRQSRALAVDEFVANEEVVIKPLGSFLEGLGPFAGATISGDGRVILLLDPGQLLDIRAGDGTEERPIPQPAPEQELPDPGRRAHGRLLLVDDSISVRKVVGQMLERAGFAVVTATDGADALERLNEASVDAVITDLEMPRVNGYELIQDLRRRPATLTLPIVVLTTRAGDKHVDLARRLGVHHYVSKPVDEASFVRLIGSLAALPAPAGTGRAS